MAKAHRRAAADRSAGAGGSGPDGPPVAAVRTLTDLQMLLGNPSNASASGPANFLIRRTQYALSYARDRGTPNWVSWHLSKASLGQIRRTGKFLVDTSLPIGWHQVNPGEYTRTGYNRGHMCPSEHRTATLPDNLAVFLMTNIIPRHPGTTRAPGSSWGTTPATSRGWTCS